MVLLITGVFVLLVLGCGGSEPVRSNEFTPGSGPDVTELSLGRNPGAPWVFRPRSDVPDWDTSLPIDWSADPFHDINWQYHLHSWRSMDYWLYEYRQDGDAAHMLAPVQIALDWHRFHIEEERKSAFQWYDHSTGVRASRLAFLLDLILSDQIEVPNADLDRLMTLADLHAERLMEPSFLSRLNHGLFQLVGLDALCSVTSWREACQGARSYARESFATLVKGWFSEEGVHVENSPSYHGWVIRKLRDLGAAETFQQPEIAEILERADAITPWLTLPDGRWVPVGDSDGTGPQLNGPVERNCPPNGAGCWAVLDLTRSGYVIIRSLPESDDSESSMLFVSAMAPLTGHKHSDDLSFVLMEGGRDIFVDSGKYGYDYDDMRSYVISASAHNVPSLVGRGISPRDIDPASSGLDPVKVDDGQFVISGVADRPGLFLHERTLFYVPGILLRIEDRLNNLTDSSWQSNLHLAPDLTPEVGEAGFEVQAGDLTIRAEFSGDGCNISTARGETEPHQGWVSIGYLQMTPATVVTATCPADLVESSWHITFEQ